MARSVSHHPAAVEVVYLRGIIFESDIIYPEGHDFDSDEQPQYDYLDFSEFLDELKKVLHKSFSSLRHCDRWIGNENHVILENGPAEVSVAEYCGLISVSLAPKDGSDEDYDQETGRNAIWSGRVANHFRECLHKRYKPFALILLGTASNGEAFFRPLARPDGMFTSKEGELW